MVRSGSKASQLHQYFFKLVAHSPKVQNRKYYNTNLRHFLSFVKIKIRPTKERTSFTEFHCVIYTTFSQPRQDFRDHLNKVLYTLYFYIPETEDMLHVSHCTMINSTRLEPSQQKIPYLHDTTLGIAYYL